MNREIWKPHRITTLVLIGIIFLAILAGLSLGHESLVSSTDTDMGTVKAQQLPLNLTDTPTPTPTPSPDDNDNDGGEASGQTLVVNNAGGVADDVIDGDDCENAEYVTIQNAIDDAEPGDTVNVCAGTYVESISISTAKLTVQTIDDAVIEGLDGAVVRSTASEVTIRGFDIHADQGATYGIVVGGEETVVRDNTVEAANGTGIYLSDGFSNQGKPDPGLGAASRSRIVNNTVTAFNFRIWADADQAVIRNNNVSDLNVDPDSERRSCTSNDCEGANHSIVSSGNNTTIRNNTVEYTNHPPSLNTPLGSGIVVGLSAMPGRSNYSAPERGAWHDEAHNNLVLNNSVSNAPGGDWGGIGLLQGAKGAVVRNNILTGNFRGIKMFSNDTVIRNNTITRMGYGVPGDGMVIYGNARIFGNTVSLYGVGIKIRGHAEVRENTIQNNLYGIYVGHSYYDLIPTSARIIGNDIIENRGDGIRLTGCGVNSYCGPKSSTEQVHIHRNRIMDNADLGINNQNASYIVNARNNIWDCGGPSSGFNELADPYTGRLANGSGDAITAGNGTTHNEVPISNVHFDPFHELESCPDSQSTPTPTPTPTHTSTPTSTPSSNAAGGSGGDGTGSGDGSGDGTGGTDGEVGSESTSGDDSGGATGETTTSSPTPPATLTATPPPTPTPTPVVEPGFGAGTWLVGVAILIGLLVVRRRTTSEGDEPHD